MASRCCGKHSPLTPTISLPVQCSEIVKLGCRGNSVKDASFRSSCEPQPRLTTCTTDDSRCASSMTTRCLLVLGLLLTCLLQEPTDIDEHMPTLRDYASRVGIVAEMGVRTIVSTYAFLKVRRRLCPCAQMPTTRVCGSALNV